LGDAAVESVVRIEALFAASQIVEISDAVKLRAAQRAIEKRAPFHRQRNSMGDSILIEVYAEITVATRRDGGRSAFVTHNVNDFSQLTGDNRLPHPDIAPLFSKIKSLYSTNLGELLRRVDPSLLAELKFEEEFIFEPRSAGEISSVAEELAQKIWYDRHQLRQQSIDKGLCQIVADQDWDLSMAHNTIKKSIWDGAKKAAAKVERVYGKENLGPWSKFEWGMLNGKLSALRWCLGEDWDMLDT
jgi:hypothetical protein